MAEQWGVVGTWVGGALAVAFGHLLATVGKYLTSPRRHQLTRKQCRSSGSYALPT